MSKIRVGTGSTAYYTLTRRLLWMFECNYRLSVSQRYFFGVEGHQHIPPSLCVTQISVGQYYSAVALCNHALQHQL
jgi:hypothetical protein